MHVLFVEPAFPKNQREFVRALRQVGAQVTGIGESPLEAIDSDVIKEYAALGVGVGLIAEIAFDPGRDRELVRIELGEMFPTNVAKLAMRAGAQLRGFERRFVELIAAADARE